MMNMSGFYIFQNNFQMIWMMKFVSVTNWFEIPTINLTVKSIDVVLANIFGRDATRHDSVKVQREIRLNIL